MEQTIKLVIFDCYGFVLNEGYPNTAKALAKRYGRSWQEYQRVMYLKFFNQAAEKKDYPARGMDPDGSLFQSPPDLAAAPRQSLPSNEN